MTGLKGDAPTRRRRARDDLRSEDLVVCLLRGGFTRVEQTLLEGGRSAAVIHAADDGG